MAILVTCACGAQYNLKDEYAGKRGKCPKCGAILNVPLPEATAPETPVVEPPLLPQVDPAFDRDQFLLRQKHLAISEKYYVWDANGQTILFIQRPAHLLRNLLAIFAGLLAGGLVAAGFIALGMVLAKTGNATMQGILIGLGILGFFSVFFAVGLALSKKRHVTFYRDDTKQETLLEILQDKKFEFLMATYTLRDPAGSVLAKFRKHYLYDIFRKRWVCYAPDGSTLCVAREDSLALSLLRRFFGPLFGALRTNFVILKGQSKEVIGEFNRKFTLLDRYVLDLKADPTRELDRRIAIALGVLLDTGERR